MRVSIVGTGYVGLVSGVCLAERGHDVTCVDVDREKVEGINRGEPPIHENGLEELLRGNLGRSFRATADLTEAVLGSELTMIAVGTPFDGDEIDLRFIREAAAQIGTVLAGKDDYHVVVVKSTVVPGTTDEIVKPLLEQHSGKEAGKDFGVGMNPEFLREGVAVQDFLFPDRIVLGGIDARTLEALEKLYAPFEGVDRLYANPCTAEMIKYAANALIATTISFSNEIGNLCAEIEGVDVVEVLRGVHLDKRLSPILAGGKRIVPAITTYLGAGCGFGGSCLPKDVRALISFGRKSGNPMSILDAVMEVNRSQPGKMISLLREHFSSLEGLPVTVLGLTFKPGTNDVRDSPAIPIVRELLAKRAVVTAFDPVARDEAASVFGEGTLGFAATLEEAVTGAKAVLLVTRWPEFESLPSILSGMEEPPLLIDGRRMLDKNEVASYAGIGLSR